MGSVGSGGSPFRAMSLQHHAGLVEVETRSAWTEIGRVAVAQIANEVHAPLAVGEELRVHLLGVEAGHRAAIETERARRKHEVSALQRAVAEGGLLDVLRLAGKRGAGVTMRREYG